MKAPKLTAKQRKFAIYLAEGLSGSEAYRRAFGKTPDFSPTQAKNEAYRLKQHRSVAAYVKILQEELDSTGIVNRQVNLRVLSQQIVDRDLPATERQSAIKIVNAMCGYNSPVKLEAEITLSSILKEIAPTTGLPRNDAKRRRRG